MSSLTAATRRAFLCMFAAKVSLHRNMAILRTLVLILFQSLLYSVAIDLDDLLTLSMTLRSIEVMDVSIPRSVCKAAKSQEHVSRDDRKRSNRRCTACKLAARS